MKKDRGGKRRRFRDMIKLSHGREDASPVQERAQGVIQFETGKLPTEFASFKEKRKSNRPGTVVIVIVSLGLTFIAIIAWFIAHEPPK